MFTRSSCTSYKHDLVHVHNADLRIEYGWYGHIQHDCLSSELKIRNVTIPKMNHGDVELMVRNSPQAEWMIDTLSRYEPKTFPTVGDLIRMWQTRTSKPIIPRLLTGWMDSTIDYFLHTHDFKICDLVIRATVLNSRQLFYQTLLSYVKNIFIDLCLQNFFDTFFHRYAQPIYTDHCVNMFQSYKHDKQSMTSAISTRDPMIDHGSVGKRDFDYHTKETEFKMRFGTTKW